MLLFLYLFIYRSTHYLPFLQSYLWYNRPHTIQNTASRYVWTEYLAYEPIYFSVYVFYYCAVCFQRFKRKSSHPTYPSQSKYGRTCVSGMREMGWDFFTNHILNKDTVDFKIDFKLE